MTTPTITPSNGINIAQISDLYMNNMMITFFGDIMNNKMELTLYNIIILLLILSLSEIKKIVAEYLPKSIDYLKMFVKYIYTNKWKLLNYFKTFDGYKIFKKKKEEIIEKPVEVINNNIIVKIDASFDFLDALYSMITKKNKIIKDILLDKVDIKNKKDIISHYKISNVKLYYNNTNIIIDDAIIFCVRNDNNSVVSAKIADNEFTSESTSFTDILHNKVSNVIKCIKKKIIDEHQDIKSAINKLVKAHMSNNYTEYHLAENFSNIYKFDYNETLLDIMIYNVLLKINGFNTFMYTLRNTFNNNFKNSYKISWLKINHELLKQFKIPINLETYSHGQDNYGYISDILKSIDIDRDYGDYLHYDIINEKKEDKKYLNLLLKPNDEINDINKLVNQLINKIYNYSKAKNIKKIKINFLKINTNIETKEIENPEFTKWMEKKKLIDESFNDTNNETTDNNIKDSPKKYLKFLTNNMPDKTIIKETETKMIECKQLNECYKDLDTLYLRKKDKEKLVNCLIQFRDKKDVLLNLGLQNKLNILLYGEPGTGKSTAIQAIASYLNKNIYYIDLKDAKTNDDLHLMFEYVNKNVLNGGIIVLEDIDAMTNVVLDRKNRINIIDNGFNKLDNVSNLLNNSDKVTLEYLLNILQGTLTMDDSVFIVTTNHIDHLDPAFYRDGRFDTKIELKKCDHFQINTIFNKIMNRNIDENILKLIPENEFTPATIIFHIKNYIFDNEITDKEILEPFIKDI